MSNIKEYFQSNKYGKYLYNNIFNILSNMAIPSQASEETPRRCND